jgi:hypothetical protein
MLCLDLRRFCETARDAPYDFAGELTVLCAAPNAIGAKGANRIHRRRATGRHAAGQGGDGMMPGGSRRAGCGIGRLDAEQQRRHEAVDPPPVGSIRI